MEKTCGICGHKFTGLRHRLALTSDDPNEPNVVENEMCAGCADIIKKTVRAMAADKVPA